VSTTDVMPLPKEPMLADRMSAMGYPGRDNSTGPMPATNNLAGTTSTVINLGRDKLPEWTSSIWGRIDAEVKCELRRACIATKFLPIVHSLSPSEATVAADKIDTVAGVLSIDQRKVLALLEESQPFLLSKEQYHDEGRMGTAVTLASRAANQLAQAMDTAIFNGGENPGLLTAPEKVIDVNPLDPGRPGEYGENTFKQVAAAYAFLQSKGQYGPYALVLRTEQFADAHAPLPTTLIMPADRIRPLMTAGFYGTGTLPAKRGVMVSIGGNTVDVAIGVDGATAFTQIDEDENYRFRVYERSTVRVKDKRAIVVLDFK
jgi:uncharacterized linocin/CFP29 family protein